MLDEDMTREVSIDSLGTLFKQRSIFTISSCIRSSQDKTVSSSCSASACFEILSIVSSSSHTFRNLSMTLFLTDNNLVI